MLFCGILVNRSFFMSMLLDRRRSVRYLCFPIAKTSFELNFSVRDAAYWSKMQVCLTHFVVRSRFNDMSKRENNSRSVDLLRKLFRVVSRILTKS